MRHPLVMVTETERQPPYGKMNWLPNLRTELAGVSWLRRCYRSARNVHRLAKHAAEGSHIHPARRTLT